uniref:Peptidase M13 n=1 Tax=Parastrongyloides trichosuri TaxID=131310 RepID=A0A0N5A050_PARTI
MWGQFLDAPAVIGGVTEVGDEGVPDHARQQGLVDVLAQRRRCRPSGAGRRPGGRWSRPCLHRRRLHRLRTVPDPGRRRRRFGLAGNRGAEIRDLGLRPQRSRHLGEAGRQLLPLRQRRRLRQADHPVGPHLLRLLRPAARTVRQPDEGTDSRFGGPHGSSGRIRRAEDRRRLPLLYGRGAHRGAGRPTAAALPGRHPRRRHPREDRRLYGPDPGPRRVVSLRHRHHDRPEEPDPVRRGYGPVGPGAAQPRLLSGRPLRRQKGEVSGLCRANADQYWLERSRRFGRRHHPGRRRAGLRLERLFQRRRPGLDRPPDRAPEHGYAQDRRRLRPDAGRDPAGLAGLPHHRRCGGRPVQALLRRPPEQRSREKRAISFAEGALGEAAGRLYVAEYFPAESKAKMEELVANLRTALSHRIDNLTWMGAETKAAAQEKLQKFTVKIGYPNKWRDYSALEIKADDLFGNSQRMGQFQWNYRLSRLDQPVDKDEWGMTPQTVNAYYNSANNEIVFPAAILQPPFFDPDADPAVNYGGIGGVIGHEIGHGFDDQGSKSDGDGVLRNWWTEEDKANFKALTTRLGAQYDEFEPLPGFHVNGGLTMGENIGDAAGTAVGLEAYHLSLNGQPAPVIDGVTGDQRFFYGWAQVWQSKYREDALKNQIATDPHSPAEFRVIGPVRNIDAWYEAFGVKPGDKYYLTPEDRVRIWHEKARCGGYIAAGLHALSGADVSSPKRLQDVAAARRCAS